jgi:hypothetical protein
MRSDAAITHEVACDTREIHAIRTSSIEHDPFLHQPPVSRIEALAFGASVPAFERLVIRFSM